MRVWDTKTGKELLVLGGNTEWVTSVAWSPDGARIITGSDDARANVWDARTGAELLTLKGHANSGWEVAWSLNGTRVLAGSSDTTAMFWIRDRFAVADRRTHGPSRRCRGRSEQSLTLPANCLRELSSRMAIHEPRVGA